MLQMFRKLVFTGICLQILADENLEKSQVISSFHTSFASASSPSSSKVSETLSNEFISSSTPPPPSLILRFISPREGGFITLGSKSVVDLSISQSGNTNESTNNILSDLMICLDVDAVSAKRSVELWPIQHEMLSNESYSSTNQRRLFQKSYRPQCSPATLHHVQFLRTSRLGMHQMFASLEKWVRSTSTTQNKIINKSFLDETITSENDPFYYVELVISKTMVTFQSEHSSSTANNFGRLPYMLSRSHCGRFTHFKFFLYPQQWLPSTQAASIYYTLLSHPLRTENPAEACVLIGLSDVKAANQNKESLEATGARLTRLALWGNGENHIIFHYGDYSPSFDVQRAIVAASSFSHGPPFNKSFFNQKSPELIPDLFQERFGFDIEMPMAFYRCGYNDDQLHLKKFSRFYKSTDTHSNSFATESSVPSMDSRERPLLLTFKGALYDMPIDHPAYHRRTLRSIHNGRDVIIALHCWSVAPDCTSASSSSSTGGEKAESIDSTSSFSSKQSPLYNQMRNYSSASSLLNPDCFTLTQESQSYDFETLMLRSRFAAVLPGEGTHSYRLYEALQAGSIPVLLGRSARPLEGLIKWEEIAILQEDTSALALRFLEARLRLIPVNTLTLMQRRGRIVFESHFSTLNAQMSSMFALLAHRFNEVNKAMTQESEDKVEKVAEESEKEMNLNASRETRYNLQRFGGSSDEDHEVIRRISFDSSGIDVSERISAPSLFVNDSSTLINQINERLLSSEGAVSDVEVSSSTQSFENVPVVSDRTVNTNSQTVEITNPSLLSSYSHLLIEGAKAVAHLADSIGPVQRLEQTVLHLTNILAETTKRQSKDFVSDHDNDDVNRTRILLNEAITNLSFAKTQLYSNDKTIYSLTQAAITPHIQWLNLATPSLIERSLDHVRPAVANIYSILSQIYGIAGEWRHAATSVHMLLLHYGAERGSQQQDEDTKRARNTLYDLRRLSTLINDSLISIPTHGRLLDVLSNLDDVSEEESGFGLRGWGALAHFTGPAPLVSVGEHSLPFPLRSSSDSLSLESHPAQVVSHVLLTSSTAQRVADDTLLQQSLQLRLDLFMKVNKVENSKAHSLPLRPRRVSTPISTPSITRNASVAIVSICAYPKGNGNLTEISTNNLKAYCEYHGYDCFLATSSLDTFRPTAWSKILLVLNFLSKYEWIMWKDCDTFIMNHTITVEDLIFSAAKARDVIGEGVERVLKSYRGIQRDDGDQRDATEKDERVINSNPQVSPVKTFIFSSSGTVIETYSARNGTVKSTDDNITVNTTAKIINNAKNRISSIQHDIENENEGVLTELFDESICAKALPIASSSIDLIVSEDGLMLNTGVWIIRRSMWSLGWLQRVYGVDDDGKSSNISTLFPFDSIEMITGGEAESLISPKVVTEAINRMLSNQSRSILTNNRMWEQGGALWQFVNRDIPYNNQQKNLSKNYIVNDARLSHCQEKHDDFDKSTHSPKQPSLLASEDLLHSQFVPQSWFNSYPEAIAGVLRDHNGIPMHASFQLGDWMVSFSGCKGYFGAQPCEDLYLAFGKAAIGGSDYRL
jgi:hypothetical protein